LRYLSLRLTLCIITHHHSVTQALVWKISTGAKMETDWLTPLEVAARLRVHPGTLANWRYMGLGPKFTKLSDRPSSPVRYKRSDVNEYMTRAQSKAAA
jgi:hypothetical protein